MINETLKTESCRNIITGHDHCRQLGREISVAPRDTQQTDFTYPKYALLVVLS